MLQRRYYTGRLAALEENYGEAEEQLAYALQHCHRSGITLQSCTFCMRLWAVFAVGVSWLSRGRSEAHLAYVLQHRHRTRLVLHPRIDLVRCNVVGVSFPSQDWPEVCLPCAAALK